MPLAMLALLLATGTALAVCVYNTLTGDVTQTTTTDPTVYQFTQAVAYWSAVAVRPQAGDDWDISVFSSTAADPICVSNVLASSTIGGSKLDFVIGDFNINPAGTYYPRVNHFSGSQSASVQWDDGADLIAVDGTPVTQSLVSTDLIRVFDVFLNNGTTYTFDFYPQGGSGAHLLLFRNTGGGVYWVGRSAAQFDVTGPVNFVAPATGYYGVVVTNDAATSFTYALGITSSACGLLAGIAPGASVSVLPPSSHTAFDAESNFWMGLAVRPNAGDWDVQTYGLPSGAAPPVCFTNLLASSVLGGGSVDIAIGDFNTTPLGWYFGYPTMFSGGSGCRMQFTGTQGFVGVNNDPLTGSMVATDVAQTFDVFLQAGRTYALTFLPTAGMSMLLFANTGGGTYWAGRSSAVVSSNTSTTYTAPVSAWYGIAIVNDGAVAGLYSLGVGDCGLVTALANDVPLSTGSAGNAYYSFHQTDAYWSAVAVRSTAVDWDILANGDNVASPAPLCTTIGLTGSSGFPPLQDFIVGDFNHNPFGTYYIHAHQYTAGGISPANVEWDSGPDLILPNDNNFAVRATGPNDIIGCWDVFLVAGQQYDFDLIHIGGADLKLLLFRNTGGGTYWAGRSSAQFSTTATQLYTAPSSGFYGVVVVNDNGVADNYNVVVQTCDPIVALAAPPAVNFTSGTGVFLASFTQPNPYWTPVAVRALVPSEDWDDAAYSLPSGGAISICLDNVLASSEYIAGTTDFVVGDFNYVPAGTYYVRASRFMGGNVGTLEYFPSNQALTLNAPLQVRTKPSSFLVESWDVLLTGGQTYSVIFWRDAGFNVKVDVFKSTGGVFWGGRSSATFETDHTLTFVAPTSGWYGVVVVNDGGSGTFGIGMGIGVTAADGAPPPSRDELRSISPNPGRAGMRFDYALHDGGEVALDVIDMAGRQVSRLRLGQKGAGEWTDAWPATDEAGQPLRPGMYFIRIRAGSRVVGTRKVTLLE
jgi:hypothetical protein